MEINDETLQRACGRKTSTVNLDFLAQMVMTEYPGKFPCGMDRDVNLLVTNAATATDSSIMKYQQLLII